MLLEGHLRNDSCRDRLCKNPHKITRPKNISHNALDLTASLASISHSAHQKKSSIERLIHHWHLRLGVFAY
jgi:hypothetical protein